MSARRKLVGNTIALYALQGANYLFPLVTVPFLLRVIGVDRFGAISYTGSVIQILLMVTTFGFNHVGTQLVSMDHEDPERLSLLVSVITTMKAGLALLCLVGLVLITALVPSLRQDWALLAVQYAMVVGDVLFPLWLFAGMQRMALVTVLNVVSRTATIGLLFLLVRSPDDYVLAGGIQAAHFVIAGALAVWVARRALGIRYRIVRDRSHYAPVWSEATKVFTSALSSQVYGRGTLLVLGSMVSATALGHFAVAHRIVGLISSLVAPLTESFYPHICRLWRDRPSALIRERRRLLLMTLGGLGGAVLAMNILALPITEILAGEPLPPVVTILRWFSLVILLSATNVVLNIFVLALKRYNEMRRMYVVAAIVFVVCSLPLTWLLGATGMAVTLIVVEGWICASSVRIVHSGIRDRVADHAATSRT
jgi:PST family polysaccharide transporter